MSKLTDLAIKKLAMRKEARNPYKRGERSWKYPWGYPGTGSYGDDSRNPEYFDKRPTLFDNMKTFVNNFSDVVHDRPFTPPSLPASDFAKSYLYRLEERKRKAAEAERASKWYNWRPNIWALPEKLIRGAAGKFLDGMQINGL